MNVLIASEFKNHCSQYNPPNPKLKVRSVLSVTRKFLSIEPVEQILKKTDE